MHGRGCRCCGLLAHLVGDVGARLTGLVLVEHREDVVRELANRRVVDRLGSRDQGDPVPAQVRHDNRIVDPVAAIPDSLYTITWSTSWVVRMRANIR